MSTPKGQLLYASIDSQSARISLEAFKKKHITMRKMVVVVKYSFIFLGVIIFLILTFNVDEMAFLLSIGLVIVAIILLLTDIMRIRDSYAAYETISFGIKIYESGLEFYDSNERGINKVRFLPYDIIDTIYSNPFPSYDLIVVKLKKEWRPNSYVIFIDKKVIFEPSKFWKIVKEKSNVDEITHLDRFHIMNLVK